MPESLMRQRGHFVEKKNEQEEDRKNRYSEWLDKNALISEWQRLFRSLKDEKQQFIDAISDNEFLPEKLLGLANPLWQKLYYFYLTPSRRFRLMEILDMESPTAKTLHSYIMHDFPLLYREAIKAMLSNAIQQAFQIKAYTKFFGRKGIIDLLSELSRDDFEQDDLLLLVEYKDQLLLERLIFYLMSQRLINSC